MDKDIQISNLTDKYFKALYKEIIMKSIEEHKRKQLEIILKSNPMLDDYHTGIRTVSDIKSFQEVYNSEIIQEDGEYHDEEIITYTPNGKPEVKTTDLKKAIDTNSITVYSSYAIIPGTFVSISHSEAWEYAGHGKVNSKAVKLDDVAWITLTEGQYAPVKTENNKETIMKTNLTYNIFKDEFTGDTVIEFYDENSDLVGNSRIEFITSEHRFLGMMQDSIADFDPDCLSDVELTGSAYIEDIYVNRKHRNKGYFPQIMTVTLQYIDDKISDYCSVVLRAFSDNQNEFVPDSKLVELYKRYGFTVVQETEEDGIFMVR